MKKTLFILLTLLTALLVCVSCDNALDDIFDDDPAPTPSEKCLKFSNDNNSFTVSAENNWDGIIEYSTDAINWTEWDGSVISSESSGETNVLYFRGKDNTNIAGSAKAVLAVWKITSATNGSVNISGNLGYLLDYDNPNGVVMESGCFSSLFVGCTALGDLSKMTLPDCTPSNYCYEYMFYHCTSLTKAPVLPAKTLANYCYRDMFSYCTNLNEITCLATDISANECTWVWLEGVAASGTFTKAASMTNWPSGSSGIPSEWNIENK